MAHVVNGFVIVVENTISSLLYSYHFDAGEEGKAKKTFAKIIASCMTKGGKPTSASDVIDWLKSGGFRFPGRKDAWRVEHFSWVFTFMPTLAFPK